jgi:Leucine-rich repeat (LRR) protein
MKKNRFLALLSAIFMTLTCISCSDSNDSDDSGNSGGRNNLKTGQIVIKVNPELSGQKNMVSFSLLVEEITVNWGDGTEEKLTPNGSTQLYHEYADINLKEITLNTKKLIYFGINYGNIDDGNYRELTLGSCPDLIGLYCGRNQLTNLDVSKCTALQTLDCQNNQLTSLDVNKCSELKELSCDENQLTSLNLDKCTLLQELKCWNNQLTNLDVSNCVQLYNIYISRNKLTVSELNNLFSALPLRTLSDNAQITIYYNPGTDECNRTIAENKGWHVYW